MLGRDIENLVTVKMEEYTPFGPGSASNLIAGGDSIDEVKPIYSYISQHLHEAANEMLMIAPLHRVHSKDAMMSAVVNTNDKCIGYIPLPYDFLRLHTLQMEGWSRPLHKAIYAGDPEYPQQFMRWTRGTHMKPVAIYAEEDATFTKSEEVEVQVIVNTSLETEKTAWEGMQTADATKYWQTTPDGKITKGVHNHTAGTNVYTEMTTPRLMYFSVPAANTHTITKFKYVPVFDDDTDYDGKVAELIALHCARKVFEVFGMTEQVGIMTNEINSVLENMQQ